MINSRQFSVRYAVPGSCAKLPQGNLTLCLSEERVPIREALLEPRCTLALHAACHCMFPIRRNRIDGLFRNILNLFAELKCHEGTHSGDQRCISMPFAITSVNIDVVTSCLEKS